jgi:putative flippase GtrA
VPTSLPSPVTEPSHAGTHAGGLRGLYERFAHLIHELGKFGIVGAITFVIDSSIFAVLRAGLDWGWFPSTVVSTTVAATLAFIGNRFWTWRDRDRRALHREYALYFFFNVVGLLITAAVLFFSHTMLGSQWHVLQTPLSDFISKSLFGTALASAFRFWAYRRFVFRNAEAPTPSPSGA